MFMNRAFKRTLNHLNTTLGSKKMVTNAKKYTFLRSKSHLRSISNFASLFYEQLLINKNANCSKLQKLIKFQIALKFNLLMLYWCHRYENTSKESQEHIFDNILLVRPLPATNQIGKIKKIIKKSPKMRFFKNRYFVP